MNLHMQEWAKAHGPFPRHIFKIRAAIQVTQTTVESVEKASSISSTMAHATRTTAPTPNMQRKTQNARKGHATQPNSVGSY